MRVAGITMVKNEADIIGATMKNMVRQVDFLLVLDNGSTDGTREILDYYARYAPVTVIDDPEVAYYQSQKMTELAQRALRIGADWVVPFDADEIWYSPHGRIKNVLESCTDAVAQAKIFNHLGHPDEGLSPWRQREPLPLPKVACRTGPQLTIHQGNHGCDYGNNRLVHGTEGLLEIRHFPYRSPEQLIRKTRTGAAAYAATDLPEHVGAHWRQHNLFDDETLRTVYHLHYAAGPHRSDLILDPAPI